MTWEYWICLYTRTHCAVRALRASTIAAYEKTLEQFREYIRLRQGDVEPGQVTVAACLGVRELSAARAAQRRCGREPSSDGAQELLSGDRGHGSSGTGRQSARHFPKMKAKPRSCPSCCRQRKSRICWPVRRRILFWAWAIGRSWRCYTARGSAPWSVRR